MKMTHVEHYREENPDIPTGATEFINFWQDKMKDIPKEFISSVEIIIEAEGYECAYLDVRIDYERPETQEDIDEEERRKKKEANRREFLDRKKLKELLAKYPNKGDK